MRGAARALREGAPPDAQILLVVDQFEELWTLAPDRACQAFLDGLLDSRGRTIARRVVMTMRRDYYKLCSTHEGFFRRIEERERRGYYNLRRMDEGRCGNASSALRSLALPPPLAAGSPARCCGTRAISRAIWRCSRWR